MSPASSFKRTLKSVTAKPLWKGLQKLKALVLNSSENLAHKNEELLAYPTVKDALAKYINDPKNQRAYGFPRVCRTVCSSDCDYIPKVENAGEIIEKDGNTIQIMHNGLQVYQNSYCNDPERFDLDLIGSWPSDIIRLLRGHHEPQEEKAFYEVLKDIPEGGAMLELGCWWAYYSMWFNKSVPNAKNYMIEPNAKNIDFGMSNFKLNNLQGDFTRGFLGEAFDTSSSGVNEPVPMITVDSFLKEKEIDLLEILHSDIQGGEYKMLLGAQESLTQHKIRYIFISTHSDKLHSDCLDLLKQFKYHIVCEHSIREGCSADGLIVAKASSLPGIDHIAITKYDYDWSLFLIPFD